LQWILKYYNSKTISVTPIATGNLQAAWGNDCVTVLPAHNYVWTIKNSDAGVTSVLIHSLKSFRIIKCLLLSRSLSVQDGDETVYWGTANAADGQNVTIGAGNGEERQRWIFKKSG
jgi:hypothetical protein